MPRPGSRSAPGPGPARAPQSVPKTAAAPAALSRAQRLAPAGLALVAASLLVAWLVFQLPAVIALLGGSGAQTSTVSRANLLAALGAGAIYLVSHLLRGFRFALLTTPPLGVSGRTAALLHLATAPVSLVTPLKLGELLRLQQLTAVGGRLLAAAMILLVERLLDAAALLALCGAWMLLGQSIEGPAAVLAWVSLAIVATGAITFVLGPTALASAQHHIVVHHSRPRARRVLRLVDILRRGAEVGADLLGRWGAPLALLTAMIWLMELASVAVLAGEVLGLRLVEAGLLLVSRATQEWTAVFSLSGDPAFVLMAQVNLAAILVAWPAFVWFYVRRRVIEARPGTVRARSRALRLGASVKPPEPVIAIIDDRMLPGPATQSLLGRTRYSQILRRRRRFGEELADAVRPFVRDIVRVADDAAAQALARQIAGARNGQIYLRLPTFIAPGDIAAIGAVADKGRYALDSMFVGPIEGDDAPMLLTADDAAALLGAGDGERRRALLVGLAATQPQMVERAGLVDLRRIQPLLSFLKGSTEMRHFNEAAARDGLFHKSSSDIEKMRKEYSFFHVAPEPMKRFLMPSFGFWEDGGRAGYAMEYLAIPDVAMQMLHEAFEPEEFELLLNQFFAFLESRRSGPEDRDAVGAARAAILQRMHDRLDAFMAMPEGAALDRVLAVSGPFGGIAAMRERADSQFNRIMAGEASARLVFGHGDPCFSNILFDRRIGMMRLVDARGAASFEDGLMHPLYDLAKFSHSVLGGYDFINNDQFVTALDAGQRLTLRIERDGPPRWAGEAFKSRLAAEGFDIAAVRAVEMTLFLSMLPLHTDHPRKLSGFALVSAAIMRELEHTA